MIPDHRRELPFAEHSRLGPFEHPGGVDLGCGQRTCVDVEQHLAASVSASGLGLADSPGAFQVTVRCRDAVRMNGLHSRTLIGSGKIVFTDTFTVSPAAAVCSTTAGSIRPRTGTDRTLKVSLNAPRVRDVTVECTHPGRTPAKVTVTLTARQPCNSDLGVLPPGEVSREGRITRDSKCVSVRRLDYPGDSGTHYARRHTFTLDSPGRVTFGLNADNPNQLDTFLLLLRGHGADGTAVGGDDDSGPSSDALLSGVKLAPGEYTIEATTSEPGDSGGYELSIDARLDVLIEHLDGASRPGTGTVHDYFRVTPSDATCTSSSGTVTDRENGWRALSTQFTTLGDTTVTVTCTAAGYRTATATSTLTALAAVGDVTVEATANGTCTKSADTAEAGIDQKYSCTMTRGTKMALGAEATGPSTQMTLQWAADAGVAVLAQPGHTDVSVVGGTVVFSRAGTGTVTCTSTADVTLRVSIGSKTEHTTVVSVTCEPPVQITNYVPGERNGAGAMAASETDALVGTFNVAPASAICTAVNVGGIDGKPTPGGTGTSRTVTVSPAATGWLDIQVRCEAGGYATSTATARFWVRDDAVCTIALGTLAHGSRTASGTIEQDFAKFRCRSFRRDAARPQLNYYAQRYTFTMATAGWVSIGLDATGDSWLSEIDPYLLVLYGHGSGGVERARDDNSGTGDDALLTGLFLAAGNYTIEATTATAGDAGTYRLSIDADFAVQAPDQPARADARVGQAVARTWGYLPVAATVSVQSVTPSGLEATITADQGHATLTAVATHAGDYTVTVAYTASGHTSTIATTVKILCPPRHVATTSRTCTPLAAALPSGCAVTSLNTDGYWGLNAVVERYSVYSTAAPAECDSLSESGAAAYYRFTVPDRPGYLPVRVTVKSAEPRPGALQLFADGGAPSLTLWRETQGSLSFKAHGATPHLAGLFVETNLTPGFYVVEVAPSNAVSRPHDRFRVTAVVPTADRTHADVQNVGNTGLDDQGMTLGHFLGARGSLIYGAHPDADPTRATDPFYPESLDYPWLPFTTDRCSIPPAWILHLAENAIDRVAIRSGPLGWLAAHFLLPDAEEIQDHPQFGGETVPLVYGCMRHDFNWRNLHRVKHYFGYDTVGGTWNDTVRGDADTRLGADLYVLCDANQPGAPEASAVFTWELPSMEAIRKCKRAAEAIEAALGALPFGWIEYDHE